MQQITPFLWFDDQAEEAMNFYVSVFEDAKVLNVARYPEDAPRAAGTVMTATFEIKGARFTALNGGPQFAFSPAISFLVNCDSQDEIDRYWEKLVDGGQTLQCGWVTDKFKVTWQIVPAVFFDMISDDDDEKTNRVMQALWGMEKVDIAGLQRAFDGATT